MVGGGITGALLADHLTSRGHQVVVIDRKKLGHGSSAGRSEKERTAAVDRSRAGCPNIHAAYGYGGNGITFSYLASRMIAAKISGEKQASFEHFALDRPAPQS